MIDDLPPGWVLSTLGDIADVQLGRQRSPQHHNGRQMRPYLRAANVTWNGVSLDDVKEMNFDDNDFETYRLEPGDMLLNEASGSPNEVGKPAIWRGEIEDCCFQNTLLRLRARAVDVDYLYWFCLFSALTGRFGEAGRGVNIRHLGKQGLMRFPIAVAPRTQRGRIVAAIEEHFSRLDAANASLDAAKLRCQALLKSILVGAIPSELPPCWRMTTVDEAGETGLGRQRSPKYHSGPNMKPYLRVANVFEDRIDASDIMEMHFDATDFDKYRLEVGDVLLNEGQSPEFLGRPAIYRGDPPNIAFTNSLIRFVPGPDVISEWALLVFRRHMHSGRFMKESRITTNIAHLALGRFRTVEFPVPPLEVQGALVAATRAALDSVDRTLEQIRSAVARTAALRRSVLASAFGGHLLPQGPDVEPAADLTG
ncbi:restriction endonuclease subunit S [Candidatus Poriferisodalis sp.]|uniref:restriction endonuclease subunit S n=1 Tax=Candidatus Poriferisodalis sp. TaxID=3101277 RepID=UPI003B52B670